MLLRQLFATLILFLGYELGAQPNEPPRMFRAECYASKEPWLSWYWSFHQKGWSFFSDAPIRSTPLVVDHLIYFGNAEGQILLFGQKFKEPALGV